MQNDGQPGFSYVKERLRGIFFTPVSISPPPDDVVQQKDIEIPTRDGTVLRANLFRPRQPGRYPVLISYHPYGKDNLPKLILGRHHPLVTYRLLRQTGPIAFSALTGWEAPDPVTWTRQGYVVINADMRGFFRSDGEALLFSQQEGEDYYDLIEWAGAQEWSSGKVGLSGVSYLALTQWRAAALAPPSLAAICPWEGFSDVYRDLAFPGGIREDGFTDFWFARLDRRRVKENIRQTQMSHPLRDAGWAAKAVDLEKIQVPALICGSFSDHNLHTRGSFAAFERIGSKHKWLYTHRTGKWQAYYSADAMAWQKRFFDCFLKGEDNGMKDVPPVRLEIRETGRAVHQVRPEPAWPLPQTVWKPLYLTADGGLRSEAVILSQQTSVHFPEDRLSFSHVFEKDTELTGPMKVKLHVSVSGTDDLCLFAGLRKLRGQEHVFFEGSYGFGCDLVTRGFLRLSQRELDATRSTSFRPVQSHEARQPLQSGQVYCVEVELLPSSTLFRAGESLRLDLQGRYFFRRHPMLGQFPAGYETSSPGSLVLHAGGQHDSHLLLAHIPL